MQKIALPFVACLLALAAAGAQAQPLWKWRDAAGQLHISDKAPPADTPAKNIISSPAGGVHPTPAPAATDAETGTAAPAANGAASGVETALDKKKKAAEKEFADKKQADHAALDAQNAAIRKDNCSRAQSSQLAIQSGQRIARTNTANGEREVLDDAGRAEELKHVQDVVAANCGAAPAAR